MTGTQRGDWQDVRGIWAIVYEVDPDRRAEYLDWFHSIHIPEKLDRPGYLVAAHYRIVGPGRVGGDRWIALFGAADTRAFLDPSPGQLRLQQDDLTRRMVAHRRGALHLVLAEEWRAAGMQSPEGFNAAGAPFVSLRLFDANGSDDAVGAWYAQEHMPVLARAAGCLRVRKLLASVGGPRHALLSEHATTGADIAVAAALPLQAPAHAALPGFPVLGERVWPAPEMGGNRAT